MSKGFKTFQVPLKGSPHQLAYHAEANLYAVIVSSQVRLFVIFMVFCAAPLSSVELILHVVFIWKCSVVIYV
jgi:hypothetical protein